MKIPFDLVTVVLGDPLTLNCSYNCSAGFVRGCWSKASENPVCLGDNILGSFCTVSLRLPNVSTEDLKYNYSCYTEDTDHPQLKKKIERVVSLHVEVPNWTVTPRTETTNASVPAKPKDSSGGEFTGMKVLATVTVSVAMVLAALAVYLCLNRSRQSWNGSLSTQSERVTLRIPTPDNESDTEVPYADIMITVRGVSTPELTQVGYLTPGDQKEWWGDESRSHLQASRSADRLHVPQPREVSRKMSTNSEYAVITYA
eukprot:superscaffoldBa00000385_g4290